jgi:V/A-type H+-transporting ATPase subunit A
MLREGFLVQSAFHEVDRYCPPNKQVALLKLFTDFYNSTRPLIEQGIPIDQIRDLDIIREIMRLKERESEQAISDVKVTMSGQISALVEQYGVNTQ